MLEVENLQVSYGLIPALKGVTFKVDKGSIVTLIGANGAGKTTTLKAISGLQRPSAGSITFDGRQIDQCSASDIVGMGIAHVPEGRKVFRNLTVRENLLMGGYSAKDKTMVRRNMERMFDLFPILRERYGQLGSRLSGGQQQMLAFARAMISGPRLLLLDEPSMGLAPQIVDDIIDTIVKIRKEGVTVLLVEQNANLALTIADYGHVLETGRIELSGTNRDLLENEKVRCTYLGM